MTTSKAIAFWTMECLHQMGVRDIIFSPGSRNAPLIIAASADARFSIITLGDERSAAFHALGRIQSTGRPVAVCATSGSAIANYHPAVLEAFYSHLPLVVVTADRPQLRIGRGEGQTCVQAGFFEVHIGWSVHLDEGVSPQKAKSDLERAVERLSTTHLPVHINLSFEEPLYEQVEAHSPLEIQPYEVPEKIHVKDWLAENSWVNEEGNWVVVIGQLNVNQSVNLRKALSSLEQHVVFYADPTSGLLDLPQARPMKELMQERPNGVISVGGQWVDKHPKIHLREVKPKWHVHVDPYQCWDVLDADVVHVRADAVEAVHLMRALGEGPKVVGERKVEIWERLGDRLDWSDAAAFHTVARHQDLYDCVHLGNSTAVRYAGFFPIASKIFANRGIAGIDGTLSTAVGAALARPELRHICVLGDQSFLYDSNGLYVPELPKNLDVLVLNNGIGEIFNWLPGTAGLSAEARHVFENAQNVNLELLSRAFGAHYIRANGVVALSEALKETGWDGFRVIEAHTVGAENTAAFKALARV